MNDDPGTCLPTTTWYRFSEEDEPVGQVYRHGVPEVGVHIGGSQRFGTALVVSFSDLRATYAIRRFRVVARVLS